MISPARRRSVPSSRAAFIRRAVRCALRTSLPVASDCDMFNTESRSDANAPPRLPGSGVFAFEAINQRRPISATRRSAGGPRNDGLASHLVSVVHRCGESESSEGLALAIPRAKTPPASRSVRRRRSVVKTPFQILAVRSKKGHHPQLGVLTFPVQLSCALRCGRSRTLLSPLASGATDTSFRTSCAAYISRCRPRCNSARELARRAQCPLKAGDSCGGAGAGGASGMACASNLPPIIS